ncbi:hypothetical protein [Tsukamurella paurometabola]|uniref:Uncharacterized protein n=1 Tax=Tsukamurella paurometabola TaxID=2061 RepID=A0ABS5NKZ8_TSUPA|nr:hypothetical protein [Tsukamurella paurometabola]MBS4104598.1 hypothetical protein [Tsukamurella paurometabola]
MNTEFTSQPNPPHDQRSAMPFFAVATFASSALVVVTGRVWLATPDDRRLTTTLLLVAFAACAALCVVEYRVLNTTTIDGRPAYYIPAGGTQVPFIDSYTPRRAVVSFFLGLGLDVAIMIGLAVRHDGPTPIEAFAFAVYVTVSGAYAWRTVRLIRDRHGDARPL